MLWWHRNEPRKLWSIGIVLPNGDRYFPDFVVGINGRMRGGGVLLVEIKGEHLLNNDEALEKIAATHQSYSAPAMIKQMAVSGSCAISKPGTALKKINAVRVENMAHY